MLEGFVGRPGKNTATVCAVRSNDYKAWLKKLPAMARNWLEATGFKADAGKVALVPSRTGELGRVVFGLGEKPSMWTFASLYDRLPPGRYAFENLDARLADDAALGWALAQYRYDRYCKGDRDRKKRVLAWPEGADVGAVTRMAEAITLARDLINTPASDLGPRELANAATDLAKRHKAKIEVIEGKKLLERNYPAVYTVGQASARPPCLIDMRWGRNTSRRVTLVGKGVCFDSGGLDLKNSAGMRLMKKDMGGAASVLALAHLIMDSGLDVNLRVLIPAVENSVSGNAFRPGDILSTRKGLTVEVGNTDAEGRLILCDALFEADGEDPELLIDFATLTGAARVALGTELPAFFCDDDDFTTSCLAAGQRHHDPMWRMPLHDEYRKQLDSPIADLCNVSSGGFGGAITAALFLREFVDRKRTWAHIDTMAWNQSSRPGRPAGGEVFGVRAVFAAIQERFGAAAR